MIGRWRANSVTSGSEIIIFGRGAHILLIAIEHMIRWISRVRARCCWAGRGYRTNPRGRQRGHVECTGRIGKVGIVGGADAFCGTRDTFSDCHAVALGNQSRSRFQIPYADNGSHRTRHYHKGQELDKENIGKSFEGASNFAQFNGGGQKGSFTVISPSLMPSTAIYLLARQYIM